MDIQLVTEGLKFPEGPVAMADGSVILCEIAAGVLTRVAADGTKAQVARTGGGPNGAAIGPDGALYVTNNGACFTWLTVQGLTIPGPTPAGYTGGSIQRVDIATGDVETLYESCAGAPLLAPNDLVFDKQGGFWFTAYGCATPTGRDFGGLYYALADGSKITCVRSNLISPNGVGLSPDQKTVYMADTQQGRLWAFDLDADGSLPPPASPLVPPGRVIHNLQGVQFVDSLKVEAAGKVCVATAAVPNGGVNIFDPDGHVEFVDFPDMLTSNICFGGADMRDAWVTCSSTGKLFKCRWPRPGLKLNYNA